MNDMMLGLADSWPEWSWGIKKARAEARALESTRRDQTSRVCRRKAAKAVRPSPASIAQVVGSGMGVTETPSNQASPAVVPEATAPIVTESHVKSVTPVMVRVMLTLNP